MRTRFWFGAIAFLLFGAIVAEAETTVDLYDNSSLEYRGQNNPGAVGGYRAQHFSATESLPAIQRPPAGSYFSKAAMAISLGSDTEAWTLDLALYNWNTNYTTTMQGTPIKSTGSVTYTGPLTQWIEVVLDTPLPTSGQYLLSLHVISAGASSVSFGLLLHPANDGGPNNDAFTGNPPNNTPSTNREWQVRLTLASSPECSNPTAISTVTKSDDTPAAFSRPPSPGTQLLKINGTNLDAATGVQIEGPATIAGSIVSQGASLITANFDLSAAPVGVYRMVALRNSPCSNAIKDAAVTISCSLPDVIVTGVWNARGQSGDAAHKIEVAGTNVGSLSGVKLVKTYSGPAEIVGTNLTSLPSGDLEVTFDLSNAEGGQYDIVFTLASECAQVTPASLSKAFLVYMPSLTNGGFEEGYVADPANGSECDGYKNLAKPEHWDRSITPTVGSFVRNGDLWVPCAPNPTPPPAEIAQGVTGNNYASIQMTNTNYVIVGFFQTIAAPSTAADYTIYADMAVRSCAQASTALIRLLDGGLDGPEIDSAVVMNTDLVYGGNGGLVRSEDFKVVAPAGHTYVSDPPVLTIEFQIVAAQNDKCPDNQGYKAMHVDAVRNEFTPTPPCNVPPQDVDGDNDVDLVDFSLFQACFNGPNLPWPPPPLDQQKCGCLDQDDDNDVDLIDFGAFAACFNGPNNPAACL